MSRWKPRLAVSVDSSRAAWLSTPALADGFDRLRIYDTPGTHDALTGLIATSGPWHGRTWAYVNVMVGSEWGLAVGDTANPLLAWAVSPPGDVRNGYAPDVQIAMDVRDSRWKQIVVDRCVELVADGHRGVFLDDVNLYPALVSSAKVPVPTPDGWQAGMVGLVEAVRKTLPRTAEVVINLPPAQVAWDPVNGWIAWSRFSADPYVRQLLRLSLVWEIERGFSDVNVRALPDGLAWAIAQITKAGHRVVLDDESGENGAWQLASYVKYAVPGLDWLAPSAPLPPLASVVAAS